MSIYLASVGKIHLALDRFRNVNKTLLLAGLSGLAAFIGSVVGYIVNPFPTPGALHVVVWDTWIGLGIGLTVAIVQNWHLARLEVAGKDLLKAAVVSMAGGLFGGVALITVKTILGIPFGLFDNILIPHVAGWTAESLVMALAVSRAIPNLKVRSALLSGGAAGLLGGAVTGLGVLPVAVGDAFKGVFIALALSIVEQVAREAWLVVRRDPTPSTVAGGRGLTLLGKPPTLLLGPTPVRIGSSAECQVVVPASGGPSVLGQVSFANGQVYFQDFAHQRHLTLNGGQSLRFGDVTVEVGTRGGAPANG